MTQEAFLDQIENNLRGMLERVRTTIVPLAEDTLRDRKLPEQWNTLEIFAHINVFADMYLPRIELAIHKAKARQWTPGTDIRYTSAGRRDIRRANPENGKFYKTHKRYNFIGQEVSANVIKAFIINCEMMLRAVQAARAVDLNRPKVARGKTGFFRYTLGNALEWCTVHAQRHLAQIG